MHAALEEKPITVNRPNHTYVLYPASGLKFDDTCETRDEARARALKSNMCSIGDDNKRENNGEARTRGLAATIEARCL